MGVETLTLIAISVSLMLLSRAFLKKGNTDAVIQSDDKPTTISRRGAKINYFIGRRLVGYNFGWADDENRFTREEKTGTASGGKGFGGGSQDITQTVWFSGGWHVIHSMPCTALHAIYEGGEKVWEGPISKDTTPSGTLIEAENVGKFRIYWGELDQPIDQYLQSVMGIGSRWPGVCHIVWVEKRLGTSPAWPLIEYDMSCEFDCIGMIPAPYMLENEVCRGVNGAHLLAQLISAPFPYGGGLGASNLDLTSFLKSANYCIDEHLAFNILLQDSDTLDKALQGLLADMGAFLVEHNGVIMCNFIRPTEDKLPIFSDDVVMAPDPEINVSPSDLSTSRLVYTFKDEEYKFRDNDVKIDDDSFVEDYGRYREATVALFGPTHTSVATTVAVRRSAEGFADDSNVKIKALRGAGLVIPGQSFVVPGIGPLLVMSISRSATSPVVDLDCFLDSYTIEPEDAIIDDGNTNPTPSPAEPNYDLAVAFFELPESLSGGANRVAVLRIRRSLTEVGAFVWLSGDGASYVRYGQQNTAATGGLLLEAIAGITDEVIEEGPLFEVLGPDIGQVRDLSADTPNWLGGSQIAVVNNEAFFLRAVEAQEEDLWEGATTYAPGDSVVPAGAPTGFRYVCTTGGDSGAIEPVWPTERLETVVDGTTVWEARGYAYRLQGLARARLGSAAAAHGVGDTVFIAGTAALSSFAGPLLVPGAEVCLKTQPYTRRSVTSVSGATAVCRTLLGEGTGLTFLAIEDGSLLSTITGDTFIIGE